MNTCLTRVIHNWNSPSKLYAQTTSTVLRGFARHIMLLRDYAPTSSASSLHHFIFILLRRSITTASFFPTTNRQRRQRPALSDLPGAAINDTAYAAANALLDF